MFLAAQFRYLLIIIFCFGFFISITGLAEQRSFALKEAKIKVDMPKSWRALENLFEVPLTIVGPFKGEARPIIQIIPTDVPLENLDGQELTKRQLEYRTGRLNWLKGFDGEPLKFFKMTTEQWPHLKNVHNIGYRYQLSFKEYVEHSYYTICNKKLVMLQTLMHSSHEKIYDAELLQILKSVQCSGA